MDHVFSDEGVVVGHWGVVDHRCVWSSSADGLETWTPVVLLLASQLVHVLSGLIVIDFVEFGSPGPEFSHGNSINQMAPSEPLNLFLCANCSVVVNSRPFDGIFVTNLVVDVVVEGLFVDESVALEHWLIRLQFYVEL